MLTGHGHVLVDLKATINDNIEDILVVLAEIVISFSANLPRLWKNSKYYWFHSEENIYCSVCLEESAYYSVQYDAVLHNKGSYLRCRDFPLCSQCYDKFADRLTSAYEMFVYKKMLIRELTEIEDINTHIFETYLELYREIEL